MLIIKEKANGSIPAGLLMRLEIQYHPRSLYLIFESFDAQIIPKGLLLLLQMPESTLP